MSAKRLFLTILAASAVVLAVGIGPRFTESARALPPAQAGLTIPYTGRLSDEAGGPVADGAYDFAFALYATASGGEAVWTEAQEGVTVQGGAFTVLLGSATPLPQEALDGGARWLEVGIRGPGEAGFSRLSPRQELSAATSVAPAGATALTSGLSCAHTHLGETWSGSTSHGLRVELSGNYNGIVVDTNSQYATIMGSNFSSGTGVHGSSQSGNGVYGGSDSGTGVYAVSNQGVGLYAYSGGTTRNLATIRATNWNSNHGMAAYLVNQSDYHTVHLRNNGANGGVLYLQNNGDATGAGGWDFISAQNRDETDLQFRVLSSGEVRSDVGFNTPASDLAEMLPAVEGLEPGEVLVVGVDGKLARSTQAYQTTVVGVYSTQPGFVGGQPVEEELEGHIPLAIAGVVQVKASAENGPIQPGDLLVASSTPGHAMRAGPNPAVGTVIGKALGSLQSGTGVIQMLVMLQ